MQASSELLFLRLLPELEILRAHSRANQARVHFWSRGCLPQEVLMAVVGKFFLSYQESTVRMRAFKHSALVASIMLVFYWACFALSTLLIWTLTLLNMTVVREHDHQCVTKTITLKWCLRQALSKTSIPNCPSHPCWRRFQIQTIPPNAFVSACMHEEATSSISWVRLQ